MNVEAFTKTNASSPREIPKLLVIPWELIYCGSSFRRRLCQSWLMIRYSWKDRVIYSIIISDAGSKVHCDVIRQASRSDTNSKDQRLRSLLSLSGVDPESGPTAIPLRVEA